MFCNSFLVSQPSHPSHRYSHSQRRRTRSEMKNLLLTTATVLIALFQAVAAQGSLDRVLETNEENLDVDIRLFLSSRSSILSSRTSETTQSSRSRFVSAWIYSHKCLPSVSDQFVLTNAVSGKFKHRRTHWNSKFKRGLRQNWMESVMKITI